ncbi:pentapeptide repeat-containing protein [Kibdelosporangium aridum]|uniref:Pentapeptide repeat-containing protein n=2 Tax=Kibdelosporangium aridum TaxID=2030 RepID=A0A428Z7H1_KIBAR|nr:pentapeptide repeat-containing protein [Kibdelosporangium aridum]
MARSRGKRGTDWSKIATVVSTMTAVVALLFTGLSLRETQRQSEIAERGQMTDRFSRAVDHFGSGDVLIRLGGIQELHSIARDSERDLPAIAAMLSAAVRKLRSFEAPCQYKRIDMETKALLDALATVDAGASVDLSNSCLHLMSVRHARLRCAQLQFSRLNAAILTDADLTGADLSSVHLGAPDQPDTHPVGATLTGARLVSARMGRARLTHALLQKADLSNADLRGADLTGAYLKGAKLRGTNLTGTVLSGADLSDTDLAGAFIKDADFRNASITRESAIRSGAVDTDTYKQTTIC